MLVECLNKTSASIYCSDQNIRDYWRTHLFHWKVNLVVPPGDINPWKPCVLRSLTQCQRKVLCIPFQSIPHQVFHIGSINNLYLIKMKLISNIMNNLYFSKYKQNGLLLMFYFFNIKTNAYINCHNLNYEIGY